MSFDAQLQEILNKLNVIEQKLDILNGKINDCEESCKNMDSHIDFVENVYGTVRAPLNYINSAFNKLYSGGMISDQPELPQIKN